LGGNDRVSRQKLQQNPAALSTVLIGLPFFYDFSFFLIRRSGEIRGESIEDQDGNLHKGTTALSIVLNI